MFQKSSKIFERLKKREDGSKFDDFRTKKIVDANYKLKNYRANERANKRKKEKKIAFISRAHFRKDHFCVHDWSRAELDTKQDPFRE